MPGALILLKSILPLLLCVCGVNIARLKATGFFWEQVTSKHGVWNQHHTPQSNTAYLEDFGSMCPWSAKNPQKQGPS